MTNQWQDITEKLSQIQIPLPKYKQTFRAIVA